MQRLPQDEFLDRVSARFPKKMEAVDFLSKLLHLGKDAVYRRLRGEKTLTYDEVVLIATTLNISLDQLIYKKGEVISFEFSGLQRQANSFDEYLNGLIIDIAGLAKLTDAHIYYASSEIPIFLYCFFPELIKFKLFVWGRSVWNLAALQEQTFRFDLISPPTIKLTHELLDHYKTIDSTELWNANIIDNTLNQIEYHVNSGLFQNPKDAFVLYDKLEKLINHMQSMAKAGSKFLIGQHADERSSQFNLYHNEMIYTNNTILVKAEEGMALYTSFGNPNFLKSTDEKVCRFTSAWFSQILEKSNSISQQSEKDRAMFFQSLMNKLYKAGERLKYLIKD